VTDRRETDRIAAADTALARDQSPRGKDRKEGNGKIDEARSPITGWD